MEFFKNKRKNKKQILQKHWFNMFETLWADEEDGRKILEEQITTYLICKQVDKMKGE